MVAKLEECLLPTPKVLSLNPISNIIEHFSTNCNKEETKISRKYAYYETLASKNPFFSKYVMFQKHAICSQFSEIALCTLCDGQRFLCTQVHAIKP